MSTKNPYSINTQENKFNAWSLGFESNSNSIESNPFGEDLEPELFRIWEQGWKANKNRAPKAVNLNAVASSGPAPAQPTPLSATQPGFDLSSIPTEVLFQEVSKRLAEGESLLQRVKKLLG